MSDDFSAQVIMARAILEQVSPKIYEALVKDPDFGPKYGIKADPILTLGNAVITIQRSVLYDAVRRVITESSEKIITDFDGNKWKVSMEANTDGSQTPTIFRSEQKLSLPDFNLLSENPSERIQSFEKYTADVKLPASAVDAWQSVLFERAIDDEEFNELIEEFQDTPVHLARRIKNEIQAGESSVNSLVPTSRRYYDRLVGEYDGSDSVTEYANSTCKAFAQRLIEQDPFEGFIHSLYLSSDLKLTAQIDIANIESNDLIRAYEFLEKQGDKLSQLGAIEIGIRNLPHRPELEPYVEGLIEKIRDDDTESSADGIKLLSALFILVDGELSRTRLMADTPPFYRRLASLAQAALINRQLVGLGVDGRFHDWAFHNRAEQFYWQSIVDMRLAPRWNPDFAAADQMKEDFMGRVIISATSNTENINGLRINDLVLGDESNSISSIIDFPRPYFPGPLEGAENSTNSLPNDLNAAINGQLDSDSVEPRSFIALVNSAKIFQVDSAHIETATEVLRLANHKLTQVGDRSQLIGVLNGLSELSATFRSAVLAEEVRILVRRYRSDPQFQLTIDEALRVCLVASASRSDFGDWIKFTGECVTELAFGNLQEGEEEILYSRLLTLLNAVPQLWPSCSRAEAALFSYHNRQN